MLTLKDLLNPNEMDASSVTNLTPSLTVDNKKLKKQQWNRKYYLRMKNDPTWIAKRELKKQMKLSTSSGASPKDHKLSSNEGIKSILENLSRLSEPSSSNMLQLHAPASTMTLTNLESFLTSQLIQKISRLESKWIEEKMICESMRKVNTELQHKVITLEAELKSAHLLKNK